MTRVAKPKFSEKFRRLCQVAAIAETARTQEVVEGLLAVAMVYGKGPWRQPSDWSSAIKQLFGLEVPEAEIVDAVHRMTEASPSTLNFSGRSQTYSLSADLNAEISRRIESGGDLERRAQASWLAEVEPSISDLSSTKLWSCLVDYAGRSMFWHGSEAVHVLGAALDEDSGTEPEDSDSDGNAQGFLLESMRSAGIDATRFNEVASAVAVFFDGRNADRVRFVTELMNSTLNFLSINVDAEVRAELLKSLPALTIFLDSNVIYGLIGAHSQPLAAASSDLLKAISENNFPFKVYYHEKTLNELERTMESIGRRLMKAQWTPAVSKGLLAAPRTLSSIEVKYHEQNARTRTPPNVFLDRYSNISGLLKELGLDIFRMPPVGDAAQLDRQRHEMVAEYEEFIKANAKSARRQEKAYETLDHDMALWVTASLRRKAKSKSPLFSGALVLTADYMLRKFDRNVLAKEYGSGVATMVLPDALYRALRPFMLASDKFDKTFVEIFSTPEFRGLTRSMSDSRAGVAAYLATYEDLPEETATKLLTNAMLMNRVKRFDENSNEFRDVVDAALVEENEALLRERDEVRSLIRAQKAESEAAALMLRRDVEALRGAMNNNQGGNWEAVLNDMNERISALEGKPSINVSVVQGANMTQGDHYQNSNTQIGAQGRNATASSFSQGMDSRSVQIDLEGLAEELNRLREHLVGKAEQPEHYEAIANVVAARSAVEAGDKKTVAERLKGAGGWVLEAARDIGAKIAAEAIVRSMQP